MKELTGGRVDYYLAQVKHPQREEQPAYQAECEDIIRALGMTFDEGCEFKAIWRTAAARLGNGKPGQKALYDAEKRVHYATASLRQERITAAEAQLTEPKEKPVIPAEGVNYDTRMTLKEAKQPDHLADNAIITVYRNDGAKVGPVMANQVNWKLYSERMGEQKAWAEYVIHKVPQPDAEGWYEHTEGDQPAWLPETTPVHVKLRGDEQSSTPLPVCNWSWVDDGTDTAITAYRIP